MNRRGFLPLSLRGLILGAALSTGLGRATLEPEKQRVIRASGPSPSDPLGQRQQISIDGGRTWFAFTNAADDLNDDEVIDFIKMSVTP